MTLLPLLFMLNGLSVPPLAPNPAELTEGLRAAQQVSMQDPNQCVQIVTKQLRSYELTGDSDEVEKKYPASRIRDRLEQKQLKQRAAAWLIAGQCYENMRQHIDAMRALKNAENLSLSGQFRDIQVISLYHQIAIYGLDLNKPILAHHTWQDLTAILQHENVDQIPNLPEYLMLLNSALAIHRQLPDVADDLLKQSQTLLLNTQNPMLILWKKMLDGDLEALRHNDERSLLVYSTTLTQSKQSPQFNLLSYLLSTKISQLFYKNNQLETAIQFSEQALEYAQQLGNDSWQADSIIQLAQYKRENKETHLALALLMNATGAYQLSSHPVDLARLHLEIGKTYQQLHRYDDAQTYLTAAYELFRREQSIYLERVALYSLAELYQQQHKVEQTILLLEQMLSSPTPEQKSLETNIYRLLSSSYEEAGHYNRALLNYKLYINSQKNNDVQNEPAPEQNDFFTNYTRLNQAQQLDDLLSDKKQLEKELNWYLKVGLISAVILTIMGIALLWHIQRLRRLKALQQQQLQRLEYDVITGMKTGYALQNDLQHIEQQLIHSTEKPEKAILLFKIDALTNIECRLGITRGHSILRQVSRAFRQRMSESAEFYILTDRLLLCSFDAKDAPNVPELIIRIENRIGLIMRKYQLTDRIACGFVRYPFLMKSVNALKPLQTLEICGIALAAAMQLAEKMCKNIWLELFAIDCQQAAFFNGELRTRAIDAITKGLVKVHCSEPEPIDWSALQNKQKNRAKHWFAGDKFG